MNLEGIEVTGTSMLSTLSSFGENQRLALQLLREAGLVLGEVDATAIDPKAWYPVEKMLQALRAVEARVGRHTMYQVGLKVVSNAQRPMEQFPPDPLELLRVLDFGYHFNHRRHGKVMADPAAGTIDEGIGHYLGKPAPGQTNTILVVCDNPYPCEFDRGLIAGAIKEQKPQVIVTHEPGPCRKQGGTSCTYKVNWL